MDLADDIRSQVEIASAKQQLWDQGLAPEGKENTAEASITKMLLFELSTQMRDSRPRSQSCGTENVQDMDNYIMLKCRPV